jgi:hypothetical protein
MRSKLVLPVFAAAAMLVMAPAAALAAKKKPRPVTRTLTGQVVGASFPSGSRVAVPVLFDAKSRRTAKLRSVLGMLKLPRTTRALVPGGRRVPLSELRSGDVFRVRLRVPAGARRSAYPAMNATAASFRVTRRGTALSAAELQAQIAALAGYVVRELADLRAQIASLRSDLGALGSSVAALRAQVANMPGGATTTEQITTLIKEVSQLQTQVETLTNQLNTITNDLLAGVGSGDLAGALADIATLQSLVGGIDVASLSSQLSALAAGVAAGDANLQGQINTINATLSTLSAKVSFLCGGNLAVLGLGACPS